MYTEQSLELISEIMNGADYDTYLSEDLLLALPAHFQSATPALPYFDSRAFEAPLQKGQNLQLVKFGLSCLPLDQMNQDGETETLKTLSSDLITLIEAEHSAEHSSEVVDFTDPWMQQAELAANDAPDAGHHTDLNKALGIFANSLPEAPPNGSQNDIDTITSDAPHSLPGFMQLDETETRQAALTPEIAALKIALKPPLKPQESDTLADVLASNSPTSPQTKPTGLMLNRTLSELERALLEQGNDTLAQRLKQEVAKLPTSPNTAPADDSPEIVAAAENVLRRILAAETDVAVSPSTDKASSGLSLIHSQEKAPLVPGLPETAELSQQMPSDSFSSWGPAPELDMTLDDADAAPTHFDSVSPSALYPQKGSIKSALAHLIDNNPLPSQPWTKGTDPFPS